MPYSVVGCSEIDKNNSGLLFSRKAILDVLFQQGDLIYGRPPGRIPACSCGSNGWLIGSTRGSTRAQMSVSKILKGHTAETQGGNSLCPLMAFPALRVQLLVLFSRSLEF